MRLAAACLAACLATTPATIAGASDAVRLHHAPPACIGDILGAAYEGETDRYAHGVLGDAIEWSRLTVTVRGNGVCRWGTGQLTLDLHESRVFEDIEPRLADIDGDGLAEVITVESSLTQGARLTIWGKRGDDFRRLATTPFIGTAHRWLAPLGAADLDGDGWVEIAYVDRPHLARILRVWRFRGGRLHHVADRAGLTNHRIGEDYISGGIRDCGDGPEMITADAGWRRIVASRLAGNRIESRDIGGFAGPASMAAAMDCR